MQITLENIAFNHEEDLSKTGSFFLRRNETQIVRIPEWRKDTCSSAECAPAGYVISKLPATLTIKASFSCDDPTITSINIQAVEIPAGSTHILGPVQARPINLKQGKSDLELFNLPNAKTRIDAAGIRLSDINWQWQFSLNGTDWTDFKATAHRIYTVREMPTKPWKPTSNEPTEIHVPWTEVLDRACKWAEDTKDVDSAAEAVTRRVYELGQQKLVNYGDGGAVWAHEKFNCTGFLQLLKQGSAKPQTISCHDCATVVSTFSNVLGSDLSQSSMGVPISTHPIVLIGRNADHWREAQFGFHEVAWKGKCGVNDPLFDACLQVDGDGTPEASDTNHMALQPTNLVFGTGEPGSYKFCLTSGDCNPIQDKKRRSLGSSAFGFPKITNVTVLNALKEHYKFDTWEDHSESNEKLASTSLVIDLPERGDAFEGWDKLSVTEFAEENFPKITEKLFKRRGSLQEFVEITVYEAAGEEKPTEFLLQLLGHFELLNFTLSEQMGNVSFVAPEGVTVILKRRHFVAAIRSLGLKETSVIEMATAVDRDLREFKRFDSSTEIRRNDMAHPLAANWHSFVLKFGAFFPDGDMDMSDMDNDGRLINGIHRRTGHKLVGSSIRIACPLGVRFALFLEARHPQTNAVTAVFNGFVIREVGQEMILSGGFRFINEAFRFETIDSQNEGVWVITKP